MQETYRFNKTNFDEKGVNKFDGGMILIHIH